MTGGVALSVRAGEGARARAGGPRYWAACAAGPGKRASEGERKRTGRPRCWAEVREKRRSGPSWCF
jgi:hypothetical protein